jgi:hypothetical protein
LQTNSSNCIANSGLIDLEMLLLENSMSGFDVHPMSLFDTYRSRAPDRSPVVRTLNVAKADLTAISGCFAPDDGPKNRCAGRIGRVCSGRLS